MNIDYHPGCGPGLGGDGRGGNCHKGQGSGQRGGKTGESQKKSNFHRADLSPPAATRNRQPEEFASQSRWVVE